MTKIDTQVASIAVGIDGVFGDVHTNGQEYRMQSGVLKLVHELVQATPTLTARDGRGCTIWRPTGNCSAFRLESGPSSIRT